MGRVQELNPVSPKITQPAYHQATTPCHMFPGRADRQRTIIKHNTLYLKIDFFQSKISPILNTYEDELHTIRISETRCRPI